MHRIYALRIATKDRPVIFQRIVFSLFFLALFTVAFCLFQQSKAKAAPVSAAPQQEKPVEHTDYWMGASLGGMQKARR